MKTSILIAVGLSILAGIGGGALMFRRPAQARDSKAAQVEKVDVALDEFIVNLADTDDQHYLKANITLELTGDPGSGDRIKAAMPKIRDIILSTISRRRLKDLQSDKGKRVLKNAIRSAVNLVLDEKLVSDVYFTSFAMQ